MAAATSADRLRLSEKICFGVGPIGKNMCAGVVYGSFLSLYFMQTLGISPAFLSVMFFLCRIWDGVNDLFMGAIIDTTRSRFGKFRPWIFFGALSNALCVFDFFPIMVLQMISVGEEMGDTPQMLMHVAEYYEEEAMKDAEKRMARREPVSIVIMAVIVLFLLLSMLQPVLRFYDLVKGL